MGSSPVLSLDRLLGWHQSLGWRARLGLPELGKMPLDDPIVPPLPATS
jgi:hypothetical protein